MVVKRGRGGRCDAGPGGVTPDFPAFWTPKLPQRLNSIYLDSCTHLLPVVSRPTGA